MILLGKRKRLLRIASLLIYVICLTVPLDAKVVRVEVTSRSDVLNGQIFGSAGAYERILGRVYFSVPVANAHNRRIVDLEKAVNLTARPRALDFAA
jgi:hypothetical protein